MIFLNGAYPSEQIDINPIKCNTVDVANHYTRAFAQIS